jgi:hypothetical protein
MSLGTGLAGNAAAELAATPKHTTSVCIEIDHSDVGAPGGIAPWVGLREELRRYLRYQTPTGHTRVDSPRDGHPMRCSGLPRFSCDSGRKRRNLAEKTFSGVPNFSLHPARRIRK